MEKNSSIVKIEIKRMHAEGCFGNPNILNSIVNDMTLQQCGNHIILKENHYSIMLCPTNRCSAYSPLDEELAMIQLEEYDSSLAG